ncbi:MAG TPA: hypothetical protein VH519_15965 [Hyphomicrobiaceae bacterium]
MILTEPAAGPLALLPLPLVSAFALLVVIGVGLNGNVVSAVRDCSRTGFARNPPRAFGIFYKGVLPAHLQSRRQSWDW